MNFLWEVILKSKEQGVEEKNIRFAAAKNYSAYMEVSGAFLNEDMVDGKAVVEINPYYRFYDIFKNLYQPELKEFLQLRDSLTNLLLHQLAENDVLSGMTRGEYYKKLLYQDLDRGVFGIAAMDAIRLFHRDEQDVILSGLLRQYQTGSSLDIFKDMMEALIPDNIVYHSNENSNDVLIYVGLKKEKQIEAKVNFLVRMFIAIPYQVDIYYEYHFGIIGVEETMRIDEIIMC